MSIVHASLGAALLALLFLSTWLDSRGDAASFGTGLGISSALQAVLAGLGIVLDRHYQQSMRQVVSVRAPSLVWWLQRKELVAIVAVVLTWGALAAHIGARRQQGAGDRRSALKRAATRAAQGAALCSLLAFTVGVVFAAGTSTMP